MHIIGIAGHVDHGKSSLVAALTGTNPDRWIEEQLRGMTLDLGFAHLRLRDGVEAGIVDVPGHARFLHNMLAGAAGMELLVLVVAADDGVMPQTLEHLAILRYLNVRHTLVAVSKVDLVAVGQRDDAIQRIRDELRGTLADDAPLVAFSSFSGEGLDELREALYRALVELEPRDADAPAYLPIDRVFVLPGRGTIVTGTLMQGTIAAGESVRIEPLGRSARVRGLQVFGEARDRAAAGARVALNLGGVERREIERGAAVTAASSPAQTEFRVHFAAADEGAVALLRRRTHVRAYIGAAEALGTLVFDELPRNVERVGATLFLREPVFAFPGVRFVARRLTPKTLLGGGEIAGAVALGERAAAAEKSDEHVDAIRAFLSQRGLDPAEITAIGFATNLREDVAQRLVEAMTARGEAVAIGRPTAYLGAEAFHPFAVHALAHLTDVHEREPWAMGLTSIALARLLGLEENLLIRLLAALVEDGKIVARHGYYSAAGHTARLSAEQREFFEAAIPFDPAAAFLPASFADVSAAVKRSKVTGLSKAFDTLLARGALVKVADSLYRGAQVERAHELVETFIARNGSMTMAQFRDLLGTSRKFAVPFLEWFDASGITVRSGDVRMLRSRKGAREQTV